MQSPARHFHPEELVRIEAIEESDALPPGTTGLFVRRLSDDKLRAIVSRLPGLRHILTDGSKQATRSRCGRGSSPAGAVSANRKI